MVGENDRLRVEAQRGREEQEAAGQLLLNSGTGGGDQRVKALLEENELLRHENSLLIAQQVGRGEGGNEGNRERGG